MNHRCRIIGVLDNGVDGLTPHALAHIAEADLVASEIIEQAGDTWHIKVRKAK